MVERVRAAGDAGLASLFLGEHHSTGSTYFQSAPTLDVLRQLLAGDEVTTDEPLSIRAA